MTADALDALAEMWARGVPVREMAEAACYTEGYVIAIAAAHRDRFPYRRGKVDGARLGLMAERVLAGRVTVAQAARELGCSEETVRKRVRGREGR